MSRLLHPNTLKSLQRVVEINVAKRSTSAEKIARESFLTHGAGVGDGITSYSLSFTKDNRIEDDLSSDDLSPLLDERQKRQLSNSRHSLLKSTSHFATDAELPPQLNLGRTERLSNAEKIKRKLPSSVEDQMGFNTGYSAHVDGITSYSLSFTKNSRIEEDLSLDDLSPLLDERQRRQLSNSRHSLLKSTSHLATDMTLKSQLPPQLNLDRMEQLSNAEKIKRKLPPLDVDQMGFNTGYSAQSSAVPLPRSIDEIDQVKLDKDKRAIVLTGTRNPFNIVTVNTAWEELCGHGREECRGKSLGELLQGPETDANTGRSLVSKLLAGEQVNNIRMTNYTKQGRKFLNSVSAGQIVNELGKTVYFVGVLSEVDDDRQFRDEAVQLPFMA